MSRATFITLFACKLAAIARRRGASARTAANHKHIVVKFRHRPPQRL